MPESWLIHKLIFDQLIKYRMVVQVVVACLSTSKSDKHSGQLGNGQQKIYIIVFTNFNLITQQVVGSNVLIREEATVVTLAKVQLIAMLIITNTVSQ